MKNGNHILTITLFLFSMSSGAQTSPPPPCNDFVKINGKYFNCAGELFYPIKTHYAFMVKHNLSSPTTANDYYISPTATYGPCSNNNYYGIGDFEQHTEADALDQIADDFETIHQMGFNCIRTAGLGPGFEYEPPNSNFTCTAPPEAFVQEAFWDPYDAGYHVSGHWTCACMVISTGNAADPYRNRMFEFIEQILERAHNASLKIMLDVGYFHVTNDASNGSSIDHFTAYKNYLALLADYVSGLPLYLRQTLIAYVMIEEPKWEYQYGNKKHAVCTKTNEMYEVLKLHDPEHLVTTGGDDVSDVMEWDPAVMKLDFWCPHIYPRPATAYELDADMAVKRIFSQLYWLKNNCPVPWMIGETGFSAIDDDIGTPVHHYPEVMGELENPLNGEYYTQKNFAQDVIKMVRDCGGAGFSMWQFQEVHWVPANSPSGRYHENAWGLLKHGPTSPYSLIDKKPVVDVFETYLDANGQPPPIDPAGVPFPDNYYDPYNSDYYSQYYFGAHGITPVIGTVTDQNADPVEDAFVKAHVYMRWLTQSFPPFYNGPIHNAYFTFTDNSGSYSLTPFSPEPAHLMDGSKQFIRWITMSAAGSSKNEIPINGWTFDHFDPGLPLPVPSTNDFTLQRADLRINKDIVGPLTVNTQGTLPFEARFTLNVSNGVTISSAADAEFKALEVVHVESDFHAEGGSEVHIYTSPVFIDCDEISTLNFRLASAGSTHEEYQAETIELTFLQKQETVRVYPSPNTGIFSVLFADNTEASKHITVLDVTGRSVFSSTFDGTHTALNLSDTPKGIYFVQVSSSSNIYNQRVIIQ